jgi:hypothetical protein
LGERVQHFQCHIHLDQQLMSPQMQTLSHPLHLKSNFVHWSVTAVAKENWNPLHLKGNSVHWSVTAVAKENWNPPCGC